MTRRAVWNDTVIAQSDDTIVVENNHYFPIHALNQACLRPSDKHTLVRGKAPPATTTLWWVTSSTPMLPGITPSPNRQLPRSRGMWRSGRACR